MKCNIVCFVFIKEKILQSNLVLCEVPEYTGLLVALAGCLPSYFHDGRQTFLHPSTDTKRKVAEQKISCICYIYSKPEIAGRGFSFHVYIWNANKMSKKSRAVSQKRAGFPIPMCGQLICQEVYTGGNGQLFHQPAQLSPAQGHRRAKQVSSLSGQACSVESTKKLLLGLLIRVHIKLKRNETLCVLK